MAYLDRVETEELERQLEEEIDRAWEMGAGTTPQDLLSSSQRRNHQRQLARIRIIERRLERRYERRRELTDAAA